MSVNKKNKREAGFSLIEIMISLAIFGIVLAAITKLLVMTGTQNTAQEVLTAVVQDVRFAKGIMTYDLRNARCNPLSAADIGFQTDETDDRHDTDDNSVSFTTDLNEDGLTSGSNELVRYYRTNDLCEDGGPGGVMLSSDRSPGCLRRDTGGGGQPVIPYVTQLQFAYTDFTGTAITSPFTTAKLDTIKNVQITIQGHVNTRTQAWAQQFTVFIRN